MSERVLDDHLFLVALSLVRSILIFILIILDYRSLPIIQEIGVYLVGIAVIVDDSLGRESILELSLVHRSDILEVGETHEDKGGFSEGVIDEDGAMESRDPDDGIGEWSDHIIRRRILEIHDDISRIDVSTLWSLDTPEE